MEKEIEKSIKETLVIQNKKGLPYAVKKVCDVFNKQQRKLLLQYTKQLKKQGTLTSGQSKTKLVDEWLSNQH